MKYLILILCLPGFALAHDDHHKTVYETTINQTTIHQSGAASAIATSQIAKDWNTTVLQMGVGFGTYNGSTAIAIGGAYKLCKDCLLFTGSIAREDNKTAAGFGINMRF